VKLLNQTTHRLQPKYNISTPDTSDHFTLLDSGIVKPVLNIHVTRYHVTS